MTTTPLLIAVSAGLILFFILAVYVFIKIEHFIFRIVSGFIGIVLLAAAAWWFLLRH